MAEQLTLADIVGVHGIKGWIKVRPYLEDPETLTTIGDVQLAPGPKMRPGPGRTVKIDAVRWQGKGLIAHVKGLDDRTEAEALKGFVLQIDADRLPEAGEEEVYWRDLLGLEVWCHDSALGESDVLLGKIDHLLDTGANDVIVVRMCEGSVDDRERLIPWIPEEVVRDIDLENGKLWVDWFVDE